MFRSSTHRRWNKWHIWHPGKVLSQKHVLFVHFFFWKFDTFHLTLASPPSKVNFNDVIGSDAHHYRYLHVKWPRKRVSLGMFVTFIFCDLLWPDLNLFRYNLFAHVLSFSDIYPHFVWAWALCCPSNRPYTRKCENSVFYLWSYLDLTHDLYRKMLNIP